MSNYAVMPLEDYMNTCVTIREKTNETEPIKSGELADKVDEVYEAGKQAEHKAVWDAIQDYGRRFNYNNAFTGYGLMGDIFYPTYDLKPTQANSMFNCMGDTVAIGGRNTRIDFTQRFIDCGIEFDLSNCTRAQDIFYFCKVATRLPKLDLTKIEADAYARRLVYQCSNLTKIDEIVVPSTLTPTNWFDYCTALTDLTISGTIGKNGFNVMWSTKLSKSSILSILKACNISVSAVTITLPKTCIDDSTNTQTLIAEDTELNTAYNNALALGYNVAYA